MAQCRWRNFGPACPSHFILRMLLFPFDSASNDRKMVALVRPVAELEISSETLGMCTIWNCCFHGAAHQLFRKRKSMGEFRKID